MTEIVFRKPDLEHQDIIQGYFNRFQSRSCERCFSNVYLWAEYEQVEFAEINGTLVLRMNRGGQWFFSWPAGDSGDMGGALEMMERYASDEGAQSLRLYCMTPAFFEELEQLQPDRWQISYSRDYADYIYEREKLATLSGKKYHGKRNHIHRFEEKYPHWRYESLTKENADDARKVAHIWRRENACDLEEGKAAEMCVCLREIELFETLHLSGGILYGEDDPVAFSIGERLSDDTFVVHIEKAISDIQGTYPMINREFVRHECADVLYINREDDAGSPGLRRAKLSYKPIMLEEKGIAICKA